ncbi:UDP-glucuronosyltransferase 2A3-like [Lineus longissimus]|uniref:UDP-glucuronosyltransferase 2A3-like n=1 Tax=Lineus longissimus TaxID=88925 RepID=UPI00315C5F8F
MVSRKSFTAQGVILLLLLVAHVSSAGKVLVLSMQMSGHLTEFGAVGEELIRMGHEVHVVLDENLRTPYQLRDKGFKFFRYRSPDKDRVSTSKFDSLFSEQIVSESWDEWKFLHTVYRPRITYDCNLTLHDEVMIEAIRKEKFDVALVEGLFFCYHLLPYRLGIPIITLSTALYPGLTRLYPPFTVISCGITKETNTIWNRINMLITAYNEEDFAAQTLHESVFLDYLPGRHVKNLYEIALETKLWLICLDNILDCPRPAMPNLKWVGGLDVRPAKPLEADLEKFVSDAKEGVIIVSFGSMLSTLPKKYLDKFLAAFKQLPQKVVWRLSAIAQDGVTFPPNVKPMMWLPQNDLLGHKNTKLFITHSGNNGQWEGFYHGVPMLGFPTFGDQGYNTNRIIQKGFGLGLNLRDFTTDELVENIQELLTNQTYQQNIRKATQLFRNQPHPRKVAAGYVDEAIRFGTDHFQSPASDLHYAQYLMLDIYALVTAVLLFIVFLLKKLVRALLRCVLNPSAGTHKSDKKTQ